MYTMSMEQIELGNLIRRRRKALGLTLSDLAGENISVPTISNIERGAVHNVSDEKIAYLLDKLGLDEQTLEELRQSSEEELENIELELAVVRNLIETKLLDTARHRIRELEREDVIRDNAYLSAKLQLLKAYMYQYQSRWDRTERVLQKVLRFTRETSVDPKANIEAQAYYLLSRVTFYRDEAYKKAIEYQDKALELLDPHGDQAHLKGYLHYAKSVCYYHLEAYARAFEYSRKARELSRELNDMRTVALAYAIEGAVLKRQKMYDQAIQLYKRALDMTASVFPNEDLVSNLFLNMGDVYYHAKRYEEAIRCYDIAYEFCRDSKDTHLKSFVYSSYGEVYYELKEFNKAADFVMKAKELMKNHEMSVEYLRILKQKAKIELEQNDKQIVRTCEEGIDIAVKTKKLGIKHDLHFLLAKYYDQIGNDEKFMQETRNLFQHS